MIFRSGTENHHDILALIFKRSLVLPEADDVRMEIGQEDAGRRSD